MSLLRRIATHLARSRSLTRLAIAMAVLVASARAEAQLDHEGPAEVVLSTENDNLLFGTYGYIGGRHLDGSDLGRTHALTLAFASRIEPRLALRFSLSTQLYTQALDGVIPNPGVTVPIEFLELDRLTGGFVWRPHHSPLRLRASMSAELVNESEVGLGGVGQQDAFHDVCAGVFGCDTWRYDAHPRDVPMRLGAAWNGAVGGQTILRVAPWLALRVAGEVGLRAATITAGSALIFEGRAWMVLGDPRGVRFALGGQHRIDAWVVSEGALVRVSIDARLHLGPVAVRIALHRYEGGQNAEYFRYVQPNTTMTVGLSSRI